MFWRTLSCIFLLLDLTAAVEFTIASSSLTNIQAGSPFDITWTDASGAVTLLLKDGSSSDLQTVETIASGLTGTSYTWTPSTSLPTGTYALEIEDSTNTPNYSVQFTINGGAAASSSSTPTSQVQTGTTSTGPTGTTTEQAAPTTTSTTSSSPTSSSSASSSTISSSTISSSASTSSRTTSSSPTSSLSTTTSLSSITQSTISTPQPHHGLSTGAKAGIGIGVTLGALIFIAIVWFAFWYGRRSAAKNENSTLEDTQVQKPELEAGITRPVEMADGEPLSEEEKRELQRRRRAAELEGSSPDTGGLVSERAELEARRRGEIFEMS